MKCESRFSRHVVAHPRAQAVAAALLVPAIIIGALGVAVLALQAQQAVLAAPAGSLKAVPPSKTETPPPAESTFELLAGAANSGLMSVQSVYALPHNGLFKTNLDNYGSTDFSTERTL